MKVYTRRGDRGETDLFGGGRVLKNALRVEAYGEVDELNSCVGAAIASLPDKPELSRIRSSLARIQEELFIIGALLATPQAKRGKLGPPFDQGLPAQSVELLESEIDEYTNDLKPMTKFIMPGGTPSGASLHLARTVCRRGERLAVTLNAQEPLPEGILTYLNRLSDYLFTAARWVNAQLGSAETQWQGLAKKT